MRGSDVPTFSALQHDFAAHIRHPERNPPPAGIPSRRMDVYAGLVYQNIDNFLARTFRVTRRILSDAHWHPMVRDFIHRHVSGSPYFLQIPVEFLVYLETERDTAGDPPFLLELCHFEWVRLALDMSDAEPLAHLPQPPLLGRRLALSPLARPLRYRFPVHRIGPDFQPAAPPEATTWLIGYRDEADQVRFMSSNEATVRLMHLLESASTAREALNQVAGELERDPARIIEFGADMLERLVALGIVGVPRD